MKKPGSERAALNGVWIDVAVFANEFVADLVRFLIVLVGLVAISVVLHFLRKYSLMEDDYINILEKLDFYAKFILIVILSVDFLYTFVVSVISGRRNAKTRN